MGLIEHQNSDNVAADSCLYSNFSRSPRTYDSTNRQFDLKSWIFRENNSISGTAVMLRSLSVPNSPKYATETLDFQDLRFNNILQEPSHAQFSWANWNICPGFPSSNFIENRLCTDFDEIKRRRRRIPTLAQRRAANIRERRRMFNLNEAFDALRKRVPTFAYEKRLSRIETLRLAITYIAFMADIIDGKEPKDVQLHKSDITKK